MRRSLKETENSNNNNDTFIELSPKCLFVNYLKSVEKYFQGYQKKLTLIWLNLFAVQKKLTQHCKSTILQ